ncbi:SIS domain-containing protein [Pseudarthrobacter sp. RMG13]|uniref:SIS domain-containing protein n=1 Tax=Pseudarthrobacter humi TaxID=2952523 RepID=A0ABT1LPN2_9MICC|nr:SIS domain-containing protein [Pseudarthrobacter humi]MCP8999849.1 SIS domain-containing protein [Pseudarthrobacter humi]
MNNLIPVPADFEDCVQHAINQDDKARSVVAQAVERGIERVYLVGCGGSHFGTYPAFDLLDRYAKGISTQRITSAELTSRNPVGLNEKSLVVAASHSGNTPETLAAAEFAKSKGALVAGISRQGENGLSRVGDVHLDYPDTISITEPKLVHNEQIAAALLEAFGAADKAEQLRVGIKALPGALRATKDEVAEAGERIADILSESPLSYIVGGGPAYGMAKMMSWCYFQEMQWMNSAAINAGDFFHGPFEMVTENTPLIALVAEDSSRPLGERVIRFGEKYTTQFGLVDTANLSLPGIPAESRPDLSVLALMSAERRVLDHVAARRGHDTSVRRYMYKVQY